MPAVRPGLVGVDVAEHLVPSCSVHYDVLPCRGWDLAEEEVDFSCRSLLVVVGFVVVAAVHATNQNERSHCEPTKSSKARIRTTTNVRMACHEV